MRRLTLQSGRIERAVWVAGLALIGSGLIIFSLLASGALGPQTSFQASFRVVSYGIALIFGGLSCLAASRMIRRIEGGLAKRPVSVKDVLRVLSFTLSLSILPMAAVGILSAATIEAPCAEGTGTCFTTTVSYGYVLFLAQFIFYPMLFAGTTVLYARRINGLSVSELGVNRLDLSRNAILGLIGGGLLLGVGLALSPLDAILKPYLGENFFAGSFRAAVADVPSFAFLLVYGGLVAPLIEELFFRGYAYQGFRNRFGVVPGLVLSGVLFALAHLDPWDFIGITIFGVILAVLFHKTGSLVSPMVAHATNNIVVFSLLFLGYS